jgi:hypothetical protein
MFAAEGGDEMRPSKIAMIVVVVLAAVAGGGYALAKATIGAGVGPAHQAAQRLGSSRSTAPRVSPSHAPRVSSSPAPAFTASPQATAPVTSATPLCSDQAARVTVASTEGAAGTISTLWRVTNTGDSACHTFGYPGMDFHARGGWLDVQVHRGGYADIEQAPSPIVVPPGGSLSFLSYWGDADTSAGSCRQFDQVKVTLPDNFVSATVGSSGCLTPSSVYVGPVTRTAAG